MYKKRILSLLLCLTVFLSFSSFLTFADDGAVNTDKKDVSAFDASGNGGEAKSLEGFDAVNDSSVIEYIKDKVSSNGAVLDDDNGDFICWNRSYGFSLYKGQKLLMDFTVLDTWVDYYTVPMFFVGSLDYEDMLFTWAPFGSDMTVADKGYVNYKGYIDIGSKKLTAGNYYLAILAMPCDADGKWIDNAIEDFAIPMEVVSFSVKSLKRPASVKLTTGTKRVTISYKKSAGASKYFIYRSTKKSSGYKKTASTTKTKYIDKKAKKGKRYYYKVRAVRGSTSGAGVIYSGYTSPKRSGKVK